MECDVVVVCGGCVVFDVVYLVDGVVVFDYVVFFDVGSFYGELDGWLDLEFF